MIYKNGIEILKIELVINKEKNSILIHLHLSNKKVWTYMPTKIDPAILHRKEDLQNYCMFLIPLAIQTFEKKEIK